MPDHHTYMQRCLQLAALGAGQVAPNPMVGAVLVHNDIIIGEGFHPEFGAPHAEVNCINSVSRENIPLISGSTLYISLEPCSHFGKTPPCTDLIIEQKIPTVVVACRDIFAEVNGSGIRKLQNAGINVIEEVLEKEARELNKRFFTFHQLHRPYIILKWAQTGDGKIAGPLANQRLHISNEITNRLVHKWRSGESAILVGTNTALQDDPALTTRLWPGKDPVRLVIDRDLSLPVSLKLFDSKVRTIVFNEHKQETGEKLSYYKLEANGNVLEQVLTIAYQEKLLSVIVEGGAGLLQSFIDAGVWDEARVITNGQLTIGNGIDAPKLKYAVLYREENLLTDTIAYYLNKRSENV